jgi:hypothetical protein
MPRAIQPAAMWSKWPRIDTKFRTKESLDSANRPVRVTVRSRPGAFAIRLHPIPIGYLGASRMNNASSGPASPSALKNGSSDEADRIAETIQAAACCGAAVPEHRGPGPHPGRLPAAARGLRRPPRAGSARRAHRAVRAARGADVRQDLRLAGRPPMVSRALRLGRDPHR